MFCESPYCYRCAYRLTYPSCDLHCARDVARIIEFEGPDMVSAFIGEPSSRASGPGSAGRGTGKSSRTSGQSYGVLLIIDEVICGFGRTGKWFGHDHFKLQPTSSPWPRDFQRDTCRWRMGLYGRRGRAVEVFQHLHTYNNHPVSCAVALKNLEILENEGLIEKFPPHGRLPSENSGTGRPSHRGEVRGLGLWPPWT